MTTIASAQLPNGDWEVYAEPFNNGQIFGTRGQSKKHTIAALQRLITEHEPNPNKVCYRQPRDACKTDLDVLREAPHDLVYITNDGGVSRQTCKSCGFSRIFVADLAGAGE